jgi:hypothetical protein
MCSCNSYQDIKTPEELEEDRHTEIIYECLLSDFDPDEGDFKAYQSWCRKRARELARERLKEESEEEDD